MYPPDLIEYRLEIHPTTNPIPIGIWEMREGKPYRCVAVLNREAEATYEEAQKMLEALRISKPSVT